MLSIPMEILQRHDLEVPISSTTTYKLIAMDRRHGHPLSDFSAATHSTRVSNHLDNIGPITEPWKFDVAEHVSLQNRARP